MSLQNCYITRADFIKWIDSPTATDTNDDAVMDIIIEAASRYCDDTSGRRFYPFRKTRKYDIPDSYTRDADKLFLDDDLLEVYSFTNGDLTDIPSEDYLLYSVNDPPYWAIALKGVSDITWELDSDNSDQQEVQRTVPFIFRPTMDAAGELTISAAMALPTSYFPDPARAPRAFGTLMRRARGARRRRLWRRPAFALCAHRVRQRQRQRSAHCSAPAHAARRRRCR
jgi:hypothetical protein